MSSALRVPGRARFVLFALPAALVLLQPLAATAGSLDEGCDPLFEECAEGEEAPAQFPDPLEPGNRAVFTFNRALDFVLIDPLTRAYSFVVPNPVKHAVRNAFLNLDAPAVAVNDVLQLEWNDALSSIGGFLVNSTLGVGGLFDAAGRIGVERHRSDFGQTLALAGLRSGPYLILPLLGPTTVRDGFGTLVDAAMNPLLYVLGPLSFEQIYLGGSSGLSLREEKLVEIDALEKSSIDFYAALRSAWFQNRQGEIWQRREHRRKDLEEPGAGVALSGAADASDKAGRLVQ